ncbi:MAG: gliding motility-associated C-terminal domain-containing protein [Bacteroidetes bacterium]|nr:gliding motility-associated C-terminal domain-containing protein [Bacteroidota bacterium]
MAPNYSAIPTRSLSLLRSACLLAIATAGIGTAAGQAHPITEGTITACSGALLDSGGQGGGGYSNNENITATICPDVPGDAISLNFITFNLSTQGPNPIDRLAIFDGPSTASPSLGFYTGTELQGLVATATAFNTSGCLTVQFTSNANGTGIFAASISCFTPCEPPTAVATMSEPVPARICVGETVYFDGSLSHAAAGFNIAQYKWDFDDGSMDSTSGPLTSHTFAAAGEYLVQLYLTDDNDCHSINVVDLQVLVSTTPSFAGTANISHVCYGAEVDLTGVVTPVTWTGIPEANYGDGVYLPDDVGACFTSSLDFTQFDPGQTLTNVNDLLGVCVSMEHSFMGDLVISLSCPNNQSVIFHQQGGGGTFIGNALDGETDPPTPGECLNYCWTPTATNGTWVQNAGGAVLPPGDYASLNPMSALVGCPLNGSWTFQVCDFWGADDGFLCSWEIDFDPSIIPDITQFTPSIGTAYSDSVSWSGPAVQSDPNNPLIAHATPSAPGDYSYTLSVLDNFGCAYDTTITVTVDPPIPVQAGPDQTICNNAVQLNASTGVGGITYQWTPAEGLSNPNIPNPTAQVDNTTLYTVHAFPSGFPECATTDSVTVHLDPAVQPGQDTSIVVCASAPAFQLIDMLGGDPAPGGVWTDGAGNVVDGSFHPLTASPDTFTYTITSPNGCVGAAELAIAILPLTDPSCCGLIDAGPDTLVCTLSYPLRAMTAYPGMGEWVGPAGAVFSNTADPQATVTVPQTGTYLFYWHENDGVACDLWDSVQVTLTQPVAVDLALTDAICFEACDGTAQATVTGGIAPSGFVYTWSGGIAGTGDAVAPAICAGAYTLVVTDANGCADSAAFTIGEPPLLTIDSVWSVTTTCYGYCDGAAYLRDAEAIAYSFDGGAHYGPESMLDSACAGGYSVAIKNIDGCVGRSYIVVQEPPQVVAGFGWQPDPVMTDAPFVTFYNTSANATRYFWTFGELGASDEVTPGFGFPYKYGGTYPICLIAYDENLCADTLCQDLVVHDALTTYIPNAFTPDGNGTNDVLYLVHNTSEITDVEWQIFDRWGEVVFETNDPTIGWNGTYRNQGGKPLPIGTYAMRMRCRSSLTAEEKEYLGHVTLVR